MINHCLSKPAEKSVNLILHLGLVQLFFLNTSPHAATNTSVDLAKKLNHDRAAGLINAILRRAIREQDELLSLTSVTDNLPTPLKASWEEQYEPEQISAIMDVLMTTPPLDVTLKPDADHTKLAQHLSGVHIQHHTLRCSFDGDIRKMPHYDEGLWWVQDAAAALCGTLASAKPGRVVFDLCAAPGGKTAQLAAAGAKVTAVDSNAHRLTLLKANLDRVGLAADILHADILSAEFDNFATAAQPDVILLDAPCSATGTIRRRPDILVRNNRLDLNGLQAVQRDMLVAALRWVRPDGFVIYATCSLQVEEGEEIIRAVTSDRLAKLDKFSKAELGLFAPALSEEGWARILPTCLSSATLQNIAAASDYASGNDGFFIARLRPLAS
jgi:16S rRNA (cytosine967-C5)-methyltransferase